MLLRSMGPDLIVTDEIGSQEDAQAVAVALAGGANVLATCHRRLGTGEKRPIRHGLWSVGISKSGSSLKTPRSRYFGVRGRDEPVSFP